MEARGVIIRFVTFAVVVLASVRIAWISRKLPLDRLVDSIRQVPVLPEQFRRPEVFQAFVNRWYRWLPPRGLRSCLKRSYLLLDLWSRCGLEPEFHLGVRKADGFDGGENPEDGYDDAFVA